MWGVSAEIGWGVGEGVGGGGGGCLHILSLVLETVPLVNMLRTGHYIVFTFLQLYRQLTRKKYLQVYIYRHRDDFLLLVANRFSPASALPHPVLPAWSRIYVQY